MNPQNYNVLSDFWIPLYFSSREKLLFTLSERAWVLFTLICYRRWECVWNLNRANTDSHNDLECSNPAECWQRQFRKKTIMTSDGVVLLTGCSISRNPDSLMCDRCIFSLQLRLYWFSLAFRLFKCALFVYKEKKLFFKSIIFYYWQGFGFLSVWNNQRNLLRMRALASRENCLRSSQQETRISRFANVNVNYKTKLEELDWNASIGLSGRETVFHAFCLL